MNGETKHYHRANRVRRGLSPEYLLIVHSNRLQRRVHMKHFLIIAGLLLLTSFAFAADIDGKWSGTITGMDMPIEFTFKAEGQTLTGSHIVGGTETAIKDGKIDGNNISFSVTLDVGKFAHKGVLSGDQIKMTYDDGSGQSGEIIVKKAK